MASKGQRMRDLQRAVSDFAPAFIAESDRGCVLLVAALAEGYLEKILRTKLVEVPEKEDPLLDLHFASKIDLAYRLGLISEKLRRDLNVLKDIRNHFAHNIFDCDFENDDIKVKLSELKKSFPGHELILAAMHAVAKDNKAFAMFVQGTKAKTEFLVCWFNLQINLVAAENRIEQSIDPAEAEPMYLGLGTGPAS